MAELVNVADITIGERYRKDLGDIDALVASIQNVGLISPIAVNADNVLIAGQRRLEAVKRLGWDVVEVVIVDGSQPLASEHDENVVRKDFTPSERKAITDALLIGEREKAVERKRVGSVLGGRTSQARKTSPDVDVIGPRRGKPAVDAAARGAGWSAASYQRFSRIEAAYGAAPTNPEVKVIYEAVNAGEMPIVEGERRLRLVGTGEKNLPGTHMGLRKASSKSATARLIDLADALAGHTGGLMSTRPEGGDDYREALRRLQKELSEMRRQVARLLKEVENDVR